MFGKKAASKIKEIDKKCDIALGVPQSLSFHKLPPKESKEKGADNKEFKEYFDQLDNEYQQPAARRESKHEKVMRMKDNTNQITP